MALMLVVVIVVIGGAFFTIRSINASAWRADRYRVTQEALNRAKEALIAYAVSDTNRPGELPCPDVNDDGKLVMNEDYVGRNCVSLVGRLPWITLGLPDLRDASGERLWYALSNDFHANGSVALNSDTAYRPGNSSLAITGTLPMSNVVAIVFSAGMPLKRADGPTVQDRSCVIGTNCDATRKCTTSPASVTPKCNPVNYLDISGVDNADGDTTFVSATESDTFNDRVIAVLSDDIMSLVEKRAGRELAQKLRDQFDAWKNSSTVSGVNNGFYPWAGSFNDPATAQIGVSGTQYGLLPLANTPPVWTSASAACAGVGTTQLDCQGLVICLPIVGCALTPFTGQVANIATGFADPPQPADVQVVGLSLGGAASWTLNRVAQTLDFSYDGFLSAGLAHITVNAPASSAWTSSSWLVTNKWYQVSYYALSSGYAITGSNSCSATPPLCITVNNTSAPNTNKEAVIVTTGRALPGKSARPVTPPASIGDFLEAENQTPSDLAFERNLRTSTFNDQPAVVRP